MNLLEEVVHIMKQDSSSHAIRGGRKIFLKMKSMSFVSYG